MRGKYDFSDLDQIVERAWRDHCDKIPNLHDVTPDYLRQVIPGLFELVLPTRAVDENRIRPIDGFTLRVWLVSDGQRVLISTPDESSAEEYARGYNALLPADDIPVTVASMLLAPIPDLHSHAAGGQADA